MQEASNARSSSSSGQVAERSESAVTGQCVVGSPHPTTSAPLLPSLSLAQCLRPAPQEQMRKLQLDTVVRRAAIAYGGTKSEAELREVSVRRTVGACRIAPRHSRPRGAVCSSRHYSLNLAVPACRLPPRAQLASKDPSGVIREAILEEASEEAQQAYTDAQSRAKDVEMLVR